MIHSFQYNAHNLLELFQGTTKFSGRNGWKSKLEAQSTLNEDKYPRLNYVGDGFEFFVEFINASFCIKNSLSPCIERVRSRRNINFIVWIFFAIVLDCFICFNS